MAETFTRVVRLIVGLCGSGSAWLGLLAGEQAVSGEPEYILWDGELLPDGLPGGWIGEVEAQRPRPGV